jgi:glycosyltransferase involved in cell wall biosynthesis
MNIAFLASAFLREKKESMTITTLLLARELKNQGHNVMIITESRSGYPKNELMDEIPIYRLYPGKLLSHARTLKKIQKKLNIKFDIIHGFSAAPILALRTFFAKKWAAPNAKTIHTIKSISKKSTGFARILNLVQKITVPTEIVKNNLISSGVKEQKIEIIRSYIDTKRFIPQKKPQNKNLHLFYYGALFDEKGVKILLKAMPEVIKQNPTVKLTIASRHKIPNEYLTTINKLNIEKNVELTTKDIDVVDYLNSSELLILPYLSLKGTEGNPSCLLEAVACKTPVVTTNQPELKEIFSEDEIAYAKPNNPSSLAEQINKALMNKKEAQARAEKAYKKIPEFDVRKAAQDFIALYDE